MPFTASETIPNSRSGRPALEVAIEAARRAGELCRERFRTAKEVSFKGRKDIVTDVDLEAERIALGLLGEEYPDFGILAEESEPVAAASPFVWVVDPLDGTRNFAIGVPHFCTVVALSHGDQPILGVTYDPMREEIFTAQVGQGAFLNGERVSVSRNRELSESVLSLDLGYVDESAGMAIDLIRSLWPGMISLRLMGSSALGMAYAAAGRVDLYFHHSLSPWDVAAGQIQVREAGGAVVDRQGQPANLRTPSVIASNPRLVEQFLKATDGQPWRAQ